MRQNSHVDKLEKNAETSEESEADHSEEEEEEPSSDLVRTSSTVQSPEGPAGDQSFENRRAEQWVQAILVSDDAGEVEEDPGEEAIKRRKKFA